MDHKICWLPQQRERLEKKGNAIEDVCIARSISDLQWKISSISKRPTNAALSTSLGSANVSGNYQRSSRISAPLHYNIITLHALAIYSSPIQRDFYLVEFWKIYFIRIEPYLFVANAAWRLKRWSCLTRFVCCICTETTSSLNLERVKTLSRFRHICVAASLTHCER